MCNEHYFGFISVSLQSYYFELHGHMYILQFYSICIVFRICVSHWVIYWRIRFLSYPFWITVAFETFYHFDLFRMNHLLIAICVHYSEKSPGLWSPRVRLCGYLKLWWFGWRGLSIWSFSSRWFHSVTELISCTIHQSPSTLQFDRYFIIHNAVEIFSIFS